MARYLIDIFASPPVVVLVVTQDDRVVVGAALATHLEDVARRYSDQVQRSLVIADGPDPVDAQVRPTIPHVEPVLPAGSQDPRLVAPIQVHQDARQTVSYNPDRLTKEQKRVLLSLGVGDPEAKTID